MAPVYVDEQRVGKLQEEREHLVDPDRDCGIVETLIASKTRDVELGTSRRYMYITVSTRSPLHE